MTDLVTIASDALSAAINPFGAELTSLRDADRRELMANGDPAFWTGHAPILFPIVGRLNGDTLRVDGHDYPMRQHGFARRKAFAVIERADDRATFRLVADDETRALYPFDFTLDLAFALDGATLAVAATIANPGETPLPASFGFHPAFAWPLPYGEPRDAHHIAFERAEGATVKRLIDGLIAGDRPSPLDGQSLALHDALFADDALVWAPAASHSVTYRAGEGPSLRIDFPDTPDLAIWTKPGAAFVCIEPWHGHADPADFTGAFRDKPGVFEVPAGENYACRMAITLQR